MIERTNGWHARFRNPGVRDEKPSVNDLGLVHFACCLIVYRLRLVLR